MVAHGCCQAHSHTCVMEVQVDCVMMWNNPKCHVADEKRRKRKITIVVLEQILVKERVSFLYTYSEFPLLYEGIVV